MSPLHRPLARRLALLPAVLIAVLVAPAVLAQTPESVDPAHGVGDAVADSTQAVSDSTAAVDGAAIRVLFQVADQVPDTEPEVPQPSALLRNAIAQATQPTTHVFGTGLRVTLPPGWDGQAAATEAALPGDALYTFQNVTPGHPLQGADLRLERVAGLNELLRGRWSRGLTTYGYHGTTADGPATTPLPGFGVEMAGAGQAGAVVFTQRGASMWAVQVDAPTSLSRARRAEVLALLPGGALP